MGDAPRTDEQLRIGLPPVNKSSPLVAAGASAAAGAAPAAGGPNDVAASFKFGPMARALRDDDREGMRKISSAPHSINKLGGSGAASPIMKSSRLGGGLGGSHIRRVSTAMAPLSMRRPNSFMWTMDVHRDFEAAVQSLLAKGRDLASIDASEVLGLMKYQGAEGLSETSIERHLQKRQALQHKLSAMLPELKPVGGGDLQAPAANPRMAALRPAAEAAPAPPPAVPSSSTGPAAASTSTAAAAAAESLNVSSSLSEAMQRQQAMQRQMMDQQRSMQLHALEAGVATST